LRGHVPGDDPHPARSSRHELSAGPGRGPVPDRSGPAPDTPGRDRTGHHRPPRPARTRRGVGVDPDRLPLSDYLRAAGLPHGDIDPARAEIMPDEDGQVSDQLPAADTTPPALPDPEPGAPSASSGPEPEVADWLSDTDETETADPQQTSAPEPPAQDGRPEPSDLADWLSDGDGSPEPKPVSVAEPAIEAPDNDKEDEDFDGLDGPAPSPEAATDHPTEPEPK